MKTDTYNKYILKNQHLKDLARPLEGELSYLSVVNPKDYKHVQLLLQRCLRFEAEKLRAMKRIHALIERNKSINKKDKLIP